MADKYIQEYKPAMEKAKALCDAAGAKTPSEKYDVITKWLTRCIAYDYVRASRAKTIKGPDVERCWTEKMGVCADIASLACCMLRAVGIKTNVVIGWATIVNAVDTASNSQRFYKRGPSWHAWCEVYVDGKKILYDQVVEQRNLNRTKNKYTATYRVVQIRK